MPNETILKFDYPDTLLKEYDKWVVLLRPKQITAGCMILACKEDATSMPEVSAEAYGELPKVTGELENTLKKTFDFEKINYILLMMVDKHVHFHVIPRYSEHKHVVGVTFTDPGFPKHPDMVKVTELSPEQFKQLGDLLKSNWS
jgi:diadenosine tetraphosphate (Ap4A) HIT family hydrolase